MLRSFPPGSIPNILLCFCQGKFHPARDVRPTHHSVALALAILLKSLSSVKETLTSLASFRNDMSSDRMHLARQVCSSQPFILAVVILALFCGQS